MTDVFVHPTAIVDRLNVGDGTRIWAFAHVMPGARVGKNCNIGDHCFIEAGARIGDNTTIKNGIMIWEGIFLGDGVFVGPGVVFTNDKNPRSPRLKATGDRYLNKAQWLTLTVVGDGASLGAGSVILPGVSIGRCAMVGAGSIVTHDVPAFAVVFGNPARFQGWVCKCGFRLAANGSVLVCEECGNRFTVLEDGSVQLTGET